MSHADAAGSGLMSRSHFLLRRLHSLSGIMPVGVFVIFHLFTNAQIAWAAFGYDDYFQHEVDFIHSLPALLFLEIFGLWLPIAFHAGLGFWYTFTGKSNIKRYSYWDNWRYVLQRVTGMIALVFIFFHIATLRWRWDILGWFTPFYAEAAFHHGEQPIVVDKLTGEPIGLVTASTAMALQTSFVVLLFYTVGAFSVVYHWANGLWTAAISWGITVSDSAQKRWAWCCGGLGAALAAFTVVALVGSMTYEPDEAETYAMETMKEIQKGEAEVPETPRLSEHGELLPAEDEAENEEE